MLLVCGKFLQGDLIIFKRAIGVNRAVKAKQNKKLKFKKKTTLRHHDAGNDEMGHVKLLRWFKST